MMKALINVLPSCIS